MMWITCRVADFTTASSQASQSHSAVSNSHQQTAEYSAILPRAHGSLHIYYADQPSSHNTLFQPPTGGPRSPSRPLPPARPGSDRSENTRPWRPAARAPARAIYSSHRHTISDHLWEPAETLIRCNGGSIMHILHGARTLLFHLRFHPCVRFML